MVSSTTCPKQKRSEYQSKYCSKYCVIAGLTDRLEELKLFETRVLSSAYALERSLCTLGFQRLASTRSSEALLLLSRASSFLPLYEFYLEVACIPKLWGLLDLVGLHPPSFKFSESPFTMVSFYG